MSKTGFDQDALVQLFADASARQGDALRQAFQRATLKALQGRELTLKSVRDAVKATTKAASGGAAQAQGTVDAWMDHYTTARAAC